jgi:hypothetical protein
MRRHSWPGRRATAADYLGREVRQTLSLSSRLKIGAAKAVKKTIAMTRQRASIAKPHYKKIYDLSLWICFNHRQ